MTCDSIRSGVDEQGNPIDKHDGPNKHWQLNVHPLLLSKKVSHNKLAKIIERLWEGVVRQQQDGSIKLSFTVFEPRTFYAPL